MVYGNTQGVKRIVLDELDSLHGMYDKNLFIDPEVMEIICRHTEGLNREICVFISRGGELLGVGIGDATSVPLAQINIKRDKRRFNGIRCFHTHPSGNAALSDVDISALKKSRYDCMAAVGVSEGQPTCINLAYISNDDIEDFSVFPEEAYDDKWLNRIKEFEQESLLQDLISIDGERALLINVGSDSHSKESLEELKRLAETANINVIDVIRQQRDTPDREYYMGSGKLKEVAMLCQVQNINVVIFDNALTSTQFFRLEEALGIPVVDRSMLILDIFARNAVTNEGKLQVELARLKYNLPRLLGKGMALSRQGGGMKSKGEGEQQLEKDRRAIREKVRRLQERIDKLQKERDLRRTRRINSEIKTVTIVGYTNAGKSTLMNRLSGAGVAVEDKLFKTLDSVTRKMRNLEGNEYLITDTVGFINKLPHEFIDAFKSTLEEVKTADLLLHVVDASSSDMTRQFDVVLEVLNSLGANAPIITVYNKIDIAGKVFVPPVYVNSALVSAETGEGIGELKALIEKNLFS
jgi:GTP-binding protein HflX